MAHNPLAEARQLKEQLGSDRRRIVMLIGAGASQAVGIDGIAALTANVAGGLTGSSAANYQRILAVLGPGATVENVLDKVRLCRELLRDRPGERALGLDTAQADQLDLAICGVIYTRVAATTGNIDPHVRLANWIGSIPRAFPVELFTTNYDTLLELGLEEAEIPYFDGFIGSQRARFFAPSVESVQYGAGEGLCPSTWTRLWKLHGSVNWRFHIDGAGNERVVRVGEGAAPPAGDLMIFPSRDKYSESRKLPFVAYHDRLRRVLMSGEVQLVVCGYSFADEHINEILLEALRGNNRLAVTALVYGAFSDQLKKLFFPRAPYPNLTVYSADAVCVAGGLQPWQPPPSTAPDTAAIWDATAETFRLGGFGPFTEFLLEMLRDRNAPRVGAAPTSAIPPTAPPALIGAAP